MAFWRMLKQGYDHFEITRQEPKVGVCDRRYVFDAQSSGNFSPTELCPAYSVSQEIAFGRMRRSSRSLSFVEYLRLRPQPGGKAA
jgi:murein L,D-transpeptidase YafK